MCIQPQLLRNYPRKHNVRLIAGKLPSAGIGIFAALKKNKTILLKQLVAFFMALLFISVHAVKLHHTHNIVQSLSKLSASNAVVSADTDCAVCNYHFAKNGSLPFQQFCIAASLTPEADRLTYSAVIIRASHNTSDYRGPPIV